jgi:hypothetical protein
MWRRQRSVWQLSLATEVGTLGIRVTIIESVASPTTSCGSP